MNKLQPGPPRARSNCDTGRMKTEGFFFSARTSILRGLRWSCGDWRHETCLELHIRERHFYCLLIPITSRGRPVFRVVSCYDFVCQDWVLCKTLPSKKPKNFRIIIRRVQVRWHGYQRLWHSSTESERRGALCSFPASHRGPLPHETAWVSCAAVFTKGKNTTWGQRRPWNFYIRRIDEAFCLPGGGVLFQ